MISSETRAPMEPDDCYGGGSGCGDVGFAGVGTSPGCGNRYSKDCWSESQEEQVGGLTVMYHGAEECGVWVESAANMVHYVDVG